METKEMDWRMLASKYDSRCSACGARIAFGDRIGWKKTIEGKSKTICASCLEKVTSIPAATEEVMDRVSSSETAAEENLARIKFGVDADEQLSTKNPFDEKDHLSPVKPTIEPGSLDFYRQNASWGV